MNKKVVIQELLFYCQHCSRYESIQTLSKENPLPNNLIELLNVGILNDIKIINLSFLVKLKTLNQLSVPFEVILKETLKYKRRDIVEWAVTKSLNKNMLLDLLYSNEFQRIIYLNKYLMDKLLFYLKKDNLFDFNRYYEMMNNNNEKMKITKINLNVIEKLFEMFGFDRYKEIYLAMYYILGFKDIIMLLITLLSKIENKFLTYYMIFNTITYGILGIIRYRYGLTDRENQLLHNKLYKLQSMISIYHFNT